MGSRGIAQIFDPGSGCPSGPTRPNLSTRMKVDVLNIGIGRFDGSVGTPGTLRAAGCTSGSAAAGLGNGFQPHTAYLSSQFKVHLHGRVVAKSLFAHIVQIFAARIGVEARAIEEGGKQSVSNLLRPQVLHHQQLAKTREQGSNPAFLTLNSTSRRRAGPRRSPRRNSR